MRWLLLLGTAGLAACAGEAADGRPWVHRVSLHGVHSVDEDDLRKHIALDETSWVPFAPKHYLDPFTVDTDRQRIEAYYRAHGFFNARVVDAQVKPRKRDSVDVSIAVEEGAPTRLHTVEIAGLESLPAAAQAVGKVTTLKPDHVFDYDKYGAEKDAILGKLKSMGYAWADAEGTIEVNRDTRQADVRIRVTPGPKAVFGRVEVRGTSRVNPARVARRAQIDRGDRFTLEALETARSSIYNLGVFSSVRVDYEHDAQHPAIANVIVTVHEAGFHSLKLGGGFGLESQRTDVHLLGSYSIRNFLGGLRTLELRLEPAYVAIPAFWNLSTPGSRQGPGGIVDATLLQPDLFWRAQLRATVGYELGIDYAYQYHGPRASLGLERLFWHERVRTALSYNFQLLFFFNTDPAILLNPTQSGRLFGFTSPYRVAWLQQDVALDLRDRPLDASRGGYLGVGIEAGGEYTGSAFVYEKILPDLRGYLPLGPRLVLAARFEFGQLFTQGDLGSPITRRFYLGGPNSHRGFNYDRLSPQVPATNAQGVLIPGAAQIPIGGDQMVLWQIELRLNLFRIAGNWLSVATFLDVGDVAAPNCQSQGCVLPPGSRTTVAWGDLYYATGGGLRYRTLIGTLRVDLGVRLNRLSPTEADGLPNADPGQRFAFHISVGEAF
jgi:translocation and assembly module TamA